MTPAVSVCIATHNKRGRLVQVLDSIFAQDADCEVIVVDDGSEDGTEEVSEQFPIVFRRINRPPGYRNPAVARNVAMRLARADVLVLQSDDVAHGEGAIQRLDRVEEGTFKIATVWNVLADGTRLGLYTGPDNQRPLFFLGSVRREDIYAVGGNDEEFEDPGYEDTWLAACLTGGRELRPVYCGHVTGLHLDHGRPADLNERYARSRQVYERKAKAAAFGFIPWTATGGPWPFTASGG